MLTNEQIDNLYGATVGFMADAPQADRDGHREFIRAVEGAILAQHEEGATALAAGAEASVVATNLTRIVVPMLLKRSGYRPDDAGKMVAGFYQQVLKGIKIPFKNEKEPEHADQRTD